jgi:glycosyltransferase involved in cell wall biosynthesis
MWTLSALVRNFDVTVHTRGGFDLEALNELAGTSLSTEQVTLHVDHSANRWPLGTLAHAAYVRGLPRIGARYSLRVTASGVMRWGKPAIHFLSSVTWHPGLAARLDKELPHVKGSWRRRVSSVAIALLSGQWRYRGHQDTFVANSKWTSTQSRPYCHGRMEVIHPPVPPPAKGPDWNARDDVVLVFGRLSPEKRVESCIRIVERARILGFSGNLVIAGPAGEAGYVAQLEALCEERRDWIELLPMQSSGDKARLLARCRYGLSACQVEAFGIATAEMVSAGLLVLVPADCGQSDIVQDAKLLFVTEEEAAQRLLNLQDDAMLRATLLEKRSATGSAFSPDAYMDAVSSLALKFLRTQQCGAEVE